MSTPQTISTKIGLLPLFLIAVGIGALLYEILTLVPPIAPANVVGGRIIGLEPAVSFWLILLGLLLTAVNVFWSVGNLRRSAARSSQPSTKIGQAAPLDQTSSPSLTDLGVVVEPSQEQAQQDRNWIPIQVPPVAPLAQTPTASPPNPSDAAPPSTISSTDSVQRNDRPAVQSPVSSWIPIAVQPSGDVSQAGTLDTQRILAGASDLADSGISVNLDASPPETPKYFRASRAAGDAPFIFEWLPVRNIENYLIEESDDDLFSHPRQVYRGSELRWSTLHSFIRYYRLRAESSSGVSAWTKIVATWQ